MFSEVHGGTGRNFFFCELQGMNEGYVQYAVIFCKLYVIKETFLQYAVIFRELHGINETSVQYDRMKG